MHVTVLQASAEDASELFTVAALAFGDEEPAWAAYFQNHSTELGRKLGRERFSQAIQSDEHAIWHKAIDKDTAHIVGFSIWKVYQDRFITLPVEQPADSYWSTPKDAEYAKSIMSYISQTRHDYVRSLDGNAVHLNTLAVLPGYQRKGIGGRLMDWGLRKADELGFDAWVEGSVPGRPLYEKHGFVFQGDIAIIVPDEFADREKMTVAFLTRPGRRLGAANGTSAGPSATYVAT
ncbi:hypothetical protein LTR56_018470 [Elasticomyces elasticus]|nr:hypothetical protein LTR56_018470 [Elasticomyces elasticus]KAK3632660.1 hypothetical protein LTR22_020474 [Elasticomyces elasticus]KAK4912200.1 hypothetical protein LTR49_019296 [Elasticomyces elasticus]KAK5769357.1 hypothetical protein LTS12_000284 [Elasticomyces elasticus]